MFALLVGHQAARSGVIPRSHRRDFALLGLADIPKPESTD